MHMQLLFTTPLLCLSVFVAAAQVVDTAKVNPDIRRMVKGYEDACYHLDPVALATCYRLDATWLDRFCVMYWGQQDIESHYPATHTWYFSGSHYNTRAVEDIQYLQPGIATVHVRTGLSDDTRYAGEIFYAGKKDKIENRVMDEAGACILKNEQLKYYII